MSADLLLSLQLMAFRLAAPRASTGWWDKAWRRALVGPKFQSNAHILRRVPVRWDPQAYCSADTSHLNGHAQSTAPQAPAGQQCSCPLTALLCNVSNDTKQHRVSAECVQMRCLTPTSSCPKWGVQGTRAGSGGWCASHPGWSSHATSGSEGPGCMYTCSTQMFSSGFDILLPPCCLMARGWQ